MGITINIVTEVYIDILNEKNKHLDSCVFCREQNDERETNFAKIYPELGSRVLLESNNLVIFPCIGQLAPKHSLIATKQHFNTFAQARNIDSGFDLEVFALISEFKKLYMSNNEKLLIFEHGAICVDHGGCGIYHAHIHLVPVVDDISVQLLYDFSTRSHSMISGCYDSVDSTHSYVLVGYLDRELFIEKRAEPLPSQYLRKKLASQLGVDEWDWRESRRQPSLHKMLDVTCALKHEFEYDKI